MAVKISVRQAITGGLSELGVEARFSNQFLYDFDTPLGWFIGKLGLIDMRIFAKCNLGFVSMSQTSERTLDDCNDFFRGMC